MNVSPPSIWEKSMRKDVLLDVIELNAGYGGKPTVHGRSPSRPLAA